MEYKLKNIYHIDDKDGVNEINKNMEKTGVFLFYYSPMCGFCNMMMPEIEKMDKKLNDYKINKPLYKVNASHMHDVNTKDVVINGVPMLVIVGKNGYKEEIYSGQRTADEIIRFLAKHNIIEGKNKEKKRKTLRNRRKTLRNRRKTLRNRRKSYNKTRRKVKN